MNIDKTGYIYEYHFTNERNYIILIFNVSIVKKPEIMKCWLKLFSGIGYSLLNMKQKKFIIITSTDII